MPAAVRTFDLPALGSFVDPTPYWYLLSTNGIEPLPAHHTRKAGARSPDAGQANLVWIKHSPHGEHGPFQA